MNRQMLVSIGIPTYNRAQRNLMQALRSALEQTHVDLEVIVSDNCSTDGTQALVTSLDDPRIVYVRQKENIGASRNFQFCLDAAHGDYFLLLHDDDLIDPDFVECCIDAADGSNRFGFVKTGTRTIDERGTTTSESRNTPLDDSAESFFRAWFTGFTSVYLCSTLFNREALNRTGGLNSIHGLFQDGMALARISRDWEARHVADCKASFRKHAGQRTHAADLMKWTEEFGVFLQYLASQHPGVSDSALALGRECFRKLMLRRSRSLDGRLRRRFEAYRIERYFDRLDLRSRGNEFR